MIAPTDSAGLQDCVEGGYHGDGTQPMDCHHDDPELRHFGLEAKVREKIQKRVRLAMGVPQKGVQPVPF